MEATDPVTITLQASQWSTIIEVLQNTPLPYRISAPLIQAIAEQARGPTVPRGNGVHEPRRVEW